MFYGDLSEISPEDLQHIDEVTMRNLVKVPMQKGDVPGTWADTGLLRELTGFRPDTNFKDGIRQFVEWYRTYAGK